MTLCRRQDNEIVWTAFSPMASWGYTKGYDGTDGQQPRDTHVLRNYVHEWGHQEIQSSMWSNNLAALSHLENNIVFNAPRAAINFNDAFGACDNSDQMVLLLNE